MGNQCTSNTNLNFQESEIQTNYEIVSEIHSCNYGYCKIAKQNDEYKMLFKKNLNVNQIKSTLKHIKIMSEIEQKCANFTFATKLNIFNDCIIVIENDYCTNNLKKQLKQNKIMKKRFLESQLLTVISSVSQALSQLLKNKISHMDLKIQSIMIDKKGTIKITDSQFFTQNSQYEKAFMGDSSQFYLCPRLLTRLEHRATVNASREMNEKSDVFALGLIILESALGEFPAGVYDLETFTIDFGILYGFIGSINIHYSESFTNLLKLMLFSDEKNRISFDRIIKYIEDNFQKVHQNFFHAEQKQEIQRQILHQESLQKEIDESNLEQEIISKIEVHTALKKVADLKIELINETKKFKIILDQQHSKQKPSFQEQSSINSGGISDLNMGEIKIFDFEQLLKTLEKEDLEINTHQSGEQIDYKQLNNEQAKNETDSQNEHLEVETIQKDIDIYQNETLQKESQNCLNPDKSYKNLCDENIQELMEKQKEMIYNQEQSQQDSQNFCDQVKTDKMTDQIHDSSQQKVLNDVNINNDNHSKKKQIINQIQIMDSSMFKSSFSNDNSFQMKLNSNQKENQSKKQIINQIQTDMNVSCISNKNFSQMNNSVSKQFIKNPQQQQYNQITPQKN